MSRSILLAALLVSFAASAAVPRNLSHQGRLLRKDGTPETGAATLVFSLYRSASGGAPVWSETQSVQLDKGYYAVTLGSVTALPDSVFDGALHLGVAVQGKAELAPRLAVSSSAFSIRAAKAETAADTDAKVEAHRANANAHHSATSDGLAITPASVSIKGTSVALDSRGLVLGARAGETLSANQVGTLTGGGNADALHTHAGQAAAGGVCYQLWGDTACATGFTAVMTGTALYPATISDSNSSGAAGTPICVKNAPAGSRNSTPPYYTWSEGNNNYIYARIGCAICCR